ncbi:MAG: VanZ family protein [Bacteroidia bacterium]|nr:VanZ family protein [Bacteroidia bacterium]
MFKLIHFLRPFARYLLIAWVLAIIIVSSIPSVPVLKIHTAKAEIRLDYLMHFCEYGVLTFMAFLSFAGNEFKISYKKFILITICLIAFAILDEYHQKLIPGRSFNAKDIISNIAGIIATLIFCMLVFRKIVQRSKNPIKII